MDLSTTLAGDAPNQDRHVRGDNFAVVLDGATSVADDRSHDPGWFAGRLAEELEILLPEAKPIAECVAAAITQVRDEAGLVAESTPTSTVSVARWNDEMVETYVLCDSTVVVLGTDGTEHVHTDDRAAAVVAEQRNAYQEHLAAGHGFGNGLRDIVMRLQADLALRRNVAGGYWVAGVDPVAASHGLTRTYDRAAVATLVLATDGVALDRHPRATDWHGLYAEARVHGADQVLRDIHVAEDGDPEGRRWARTKKHDDKTLVIVTL